MSPDRQRPSRRKPIVRKPVLPRGGTSRGAGRGAEHGAGHGEGHEPGHGAGHGPGHGTTRWAAVPVLLLLVAAVLALLPAAALAADPISWSVAESRYGATPTSPAANTAFETTPVVGVGMTAGANKAYGMGIWQEAQRIYVFGFVNAQPTTMSPPTMAQTDLAGKDIDAGTRLKLKFTKSAGQRIDYFAVVCDPDAEITVEPEPGKTLTEASYFIVKASIVKPVRSASGATTGGAFGFVADCSSVMSVDDYLGSVFATNMHWVDIDPPSVSMGTMAGIRANGAAGVSATFDGVFPPEMLTKMGIGDPADVQGYIDVTKILTTSTTATFAYKGVGDGTLWTTGWHKYRITSAQWSAHNILYGRATKPLKPIARSPKGLITSLRPTFKWRAVTGATSFQLRVYKGSKLLCGKTGIKVTSVKSLKKLPRGVQLTWKVRAKNSAGASAWTATKFKVCWR